MIDEKKPESTTADLGELVSQLTVDQMRFVVARQEHASDKDAANAIGVAPQTVKNWKQAGAPIDARKDKKEGLALKVLEAGA